MQKYPVENMENIITECITETVTDKNNDQHIVNHVMSKDIDSGIFSSILSYFRQFNDPDFKQVISIRPIENAHIYHYHRPHLENRLTGNSVCTVHHDLNDPDPWHAKFRFIPRYMEAKAVVCLNHSQKEILQSQGVPIDSIFVVPHGYNEKILKPCEREKGNLTPQHPKFTMGIASRRYGRRVKGDAYLLELAKRLDPENFDFIFVGEGRMLSAIEFRKLGFTARAYERLPYRMFQSFYEEIDALLMCSSHEGGPANTAEAQRTCTPMFSSRIGIPKDVISDGKNGIFLTLSADTDAQRINHICVENPKEYISILENSKELQADSLTWQQSISGNLDVYRTILNLKHQQEGD